MTHARASRSIGLLVALALAAAVSLIPLATASADAGESASCVGHVASGLSPGGVPEFIALLRTAFPDVPLGALTRIVAAQHLGSQEACFEIPL